MRGLLHQNTAIYASFVSCSNLSLILVRYTVCVGHAFGDLNIRYFELGRLEVLIAAFHLLFQPTAIQPSLER